MGAFKNEKNGTWYVQFRYTDWQGLRQQKLKRGFATKREAQEWERAFLTEKKADVTMPFKTFTELYEKDVRPKLKENTWLTKEHIIKTKILPYFEHKRLCDISAKNVIAWQNEIRKMTNSSGELLSQGYLKTIHNQLSSLFNHAIKIYGLRLNPASTVGNMGKEERKEMSYWTVEEYSKFSDEMMDKEIEGKLTILEQKYPGCGSKPSEGESVDAESAGMVSDNRKLTKFPSFKGKDLDGNDVSSDDIFSSNKVTVINFWFTTCNPCVGELGDLEKLNKELAQKGGTVIGINSFTLGGDKTAISEAKDVLTKKGITYKNIWFDSNSEAGKFASGLYSYPTTYVVDKNGNIVGQPIVGAITSSSQAKQLNKLIDQAIENSKK